MRERNQQRPPDHPERRGTVLDPLKRSLQRLPYPVIYALHQGFYASTVAPRYEIVRRRHGFRRLEDFDLGALKKSNTAFIMGSGYSLTKISEERWAAIRRHDSFGFNFFLRHDHVPSAFAFEGFYERLSPGASDLFARIAWERDRDYRSVPKLVTGLTPELTATLPKLPPSFREGLVYAPIVPSYVRSDDELRQSIRYHAALGHFSRHSQIARVYKYRATLSLFIVLAHRMGYENIVLCGVDLSDRRYFYHDPAKYPDMVGFGTGGQADTALHQTMKRWANQVPIDTVLYALDELVLRPAGTRLYVENASSALSPRIPAMPPSLLEGA